MKKLNQRGFGAVEWMLLVILLAAIGGAGYYVWHRSNQTKKLNAISTFAECKADKDSKILESFPEQCVTKDGKSFTGPSQQTQPKAVNPEDQTTNWYLYETPGKEFKLRLADGWRLSRYMKEPSLSQTDNDLAIKMGTKATVTETVGGKDFTTGLIISFGVEKPQLDTRLKQTTTFKTDAGLTVTKYYFQKTKDEGYGIDIPLGGKSYFYLIKGSKGYFMTIYNVAKEDTDYYAVVEKVVKTVELP
ncbi:MAG: hypothetical protein ACXWLH_04720 [Candidatus Saccharimonadales bacterium]